MNACCITKEVYDVGAWNTEGKARLLRTPVIAQTSVSTACSEKCWWLWCWIQGRDLQVCEDGWATSGQAVDSGEQNKVGQVHGHLLLPALHSCGHSIPMLPWESPLLTLVRVCFRYRWSHSWTESWIFLTVYFVGSWLTSFNKTKHKMFEIRGQESISVGITTSSNIIHEVLAAAILLPKERMRNRENRA